MASSISGRQPDEDNVQRKEVARKRDQPWLISLQAGMQPPGRYLISNHYGLRPEREGLHLVLQLRPKNIISQLLSEQCLCNTKPIFARWGSTPIPLNTSCGDGCAFLRTLKKSDTSYPVSLQYRYGLVLLIPYYFDASSHSVDVSSPGTSIARCENQLSSAAPCQCFTLAGMFTQSPGFIATGSLPHS